jgi:MFS superfamily sulfate permease-like transporter
MIVADCRGLLAAASLVLEHGSIPVLACLRPPLSSPDFSLDAIRRTMPIAVGMTLLGLTEALSIARAIGVKSGQRIDGNREFIGQGLANIAGAFFSAYPSSGSFNRSGVNFESGARPRQPRCSHLPRHSVVALLADRVSPHCGHGR